MLHAILVRVVLFKEIDENCLPTSVLSKQTMYIFPFPPSYYFILKHIIVIENIDLINILTKDFIFKK